jgi:hypothetical protein
MSTQITLPSTGGGQGLDGTDYIYVYGDGTPLENGEELQDALYQAGTDNAVTGRRQTVVVGPGAYHNLLGNSFRFDLGATTIASLTGDTDVNLDFAANKKVVNVFTNPSGSIVTSFMPALNANVYAAEQDLQENYNASNYFLSSTRCNSDYIGLDNGSLVLYNEGVNSNSGGSGQRIVTVSDTEYVIGPDINSTFINFNINRYWVIKNPVTNLREIFVCGYWPTVGKDIFFKINLSTLNVDPSFAFSIIEGGIEDIVLDSSGKIIIGGSFITVNTYPTVNIAKILSDGTLDTLSFSNNTGSGFNNTVLTLTYDSATNKLYCGGYFGSYNGNSAPNFAILNAANATFIPSLEYPLGAVMSLKFWQGDSTLYAFGQFSSWGSTTITGRNAVLQLTGACTGSLYTTNPNNFHSSLSISATIDDPLNKILRFTNSNGVATINSTFVNPDDIIEYDINSGVITPYRTEAIGSVICIYSINSYGEFLIFGSLNFNNLALLDTLVTSGYVPILPSYNISGLNINGAFLVRDGFGDIKINNCFISSIYNISSYLDIPSYTYGRFIISNSIITKTICPASLELYNTEISNATIRQTGIEGYINIVAENSKILNTYNNGPALYLNNITCTNSFIQNSFNDGFKGDINNIYLKLTQFYAKGSQIQNSFNFSKLPRLYLTNCELQSALNFPYLPVDIDGNRVLSGNTPFAGELVDITGSGYLNQDYTFSLNYDITNYSFYQTFSMTFDNCVSTQGESLKFQNVPARAVFKTRFRNCIIEGSPYGGDVSTALNINFRPGYNQNLSSPVTDVVFENCRVNKVSTAFNIYIRLEDATAAGAIMAIGNVTINNCHHTAQNNISSSMSLRLATFTAISQLLLINIDIKNSSVRCNFVNVAFISGIENVNGLLLDNISFSDCHVATANTGSFSFLSYLIINANIAQSRIVSFRNCSSTSTEANLNYYPGYPPNYKSTAYNQAFLSSVSAPLDNSMSNSLLEFIDCEADRGFMDNPLSLPGITTMYAENCIAHAGGSFGKGVTLKGTIIRCDGGVGSFGDVAFKGTWGAMYLQAQFLYCVGINSFGVDKALGNPISGGGKLYHYTTSGGPSNWTDVTWAASNYNV